MDTALFSYDDIDLDNELSQQDIDNLKSCEACGKKFLPYGRNAKRMRFCTRQHYRACPVCGKNYNIDLSVGINSIKKSCSRKCNSKLTMITMSNTLMDKYGVSNASQIPDHREKVAKTCLEKYGTESYSTSEHFKNKVREIWANKTEEEMQERYEKSIKTNQERYGVDNGAQSEKAKEKQKQTNQERYGVDWYRQTDECEQRIRVTNLEKYGDEVYFRTSDYKDKVKETSLEKYGTDHFMKSEIVKENLRKSLFEKYGVVNPSQYQEFRKKASRRLNKILTCDGTSVDSSYEKIVYDFCIRNNIEFETQIPIEYEYQGKMHSTFIDFKIAGILFECKGRHLLEGIYDYAPNMIPIEVKLDVYRKNHVIVITEDLSRDFFGKPDSKESNGLKYTNKCPYPLIGVDISLFDSPSFPFRDDRPELFYKVSVNGQQSSYDAFYDESVRWKMIINRIMYSGGFIDSNQILRAMNVCRVCKQPSWFSKSFAKKLIQNYCSSQVIVDTFAGWGMRHDASVELKRTYIGCDLNEDLVKWHISKKRNISCNDAKSFTYDGECSVLICPPYQDIEMYFEDQDVGLTQCEWLKVVMTNVPNALEYVMVCKIVDAGWEKYVVDTKENKSHFGKNNEYVIVVSSTEAKDLLSK